MVQCRPLTRLRKLTNLGGPGVVRGENPPNFPCQMHPLRVWPHAVFSMNAAVMQMQRTFYICQHIIEASYVFRAILLKQITLIKFFIKTRAKWRACQVDAIVASPVYNDRDCQLMIFKHIKMHDASTSEIVRQPSTAVSCALSFNMFCLLKSQEVLNFWGGAPEPCVCGVTCQCDSALKPIGSSLTSS